MSKKNNNEKGAVLEPIKGKEKVKTLVKKNSQGSYKKLKIIALKDSILFPHNLLPLTSGKSWSADEIEDFAKSGLEIGVVSYKKDASLDTEKIKLNELHEVGTAAKVIKVIKLPDGSIGAIIQGTRRFSVEKFYMEEDVLYAQVKFLDTLESKKEQNLDYLAHSKALKQLVQKAISISPAIPNEAAFFIDSVQNPLYLCDLIIPYLSLDIHEKQKLLEVLDPGLQIKKVHELLSKELKILEMSQKINTDVKSEIGKQQRKYFLKEQIKQIQKELNDIDGTSGSSQFSNDFSDLSEKIRLSHMHEEAKKIARSELDRMSMMQAGSPEYMVSHTYLTWLLDIPWNVFSQKTVNLEHARKILDRDHYGLKDVKKRVLEHLAIFALQKKSPKGSIILFVGPPGVGKTSLGKSIAKALNRKFARIPLGGLKDEAEIRGHRRTYIGSMPGKFVDTLKKVKTMDPVILLDEIDKVGSDFRGDPSSALLEVLDPEQNYSFTDHYLNTHVDLSKIFFIATANTIQTIPAALKDRLEVIDINSYTLEEKENIAQRYLIPQVLKETSLDSIASMKISKANLKYIIAHHTKESGVRELKRTLLKIARGIALDIVSKDSHSKGSKALNYAITKEAIQRYLGVEKFLYRKKPSKLPLGVCTGLAWTPFGGDVLLIEAVSSDAKQEKINVTGQLGDVMKESIHVALAYIKSHKALFSVKADMLKDKEIHMHFPEGAVKKDGPSAGVAIFSSLLGLLTKRSIKSNLAMTGEISLSGEILPVGGIKEKLFAAIRYGIKDVIIPIENKKDLSEISPSSLDKIKVHTLSNLKEAYSIIFK